MIENILFSFSFSHHQSINADTSFVSLWLQCRESNRSQSETSPSGYNADQLKRKEKKKIEEEKKKMLK